VNIVRLDIPRPPVVDRCNLASPENLQGPGGKQVPPMVSDFMPSHNFVEVRSTARKSVDRNLFSSLHEVSRLFHPHKPSTLFVLDPRRGHRSHLCQKCIVFRILYKSARSLSKTTFAFNIISVRRPSPCNPRTLFSTPTSVVAATLSCLQ